MLALLARLSKVVCQLHMRAFLLDWLLYLHRIVGLPLPRLRNIL